MKLEMYTGELGDEASNYAIIPTLFSLLFADLLSLHLVTL